jgi:hypothetical protein
VERRSRQQSRRLIRLDRVTPNGQPRSYYQRQDFRAMEENVFDDGWSPVLLPYKTLGVNTA